MAARRASLEAELIRLDAELTRLAKTQAETERQFKDAQRAAQGHKAAAELSERAEEFAQAESRLPALRQARAEASSRMQAQDAEHDHLVKEIRPQRGSLRRRPGPTGRGREGRP